LAWHLGVLPRGRVFHLNLAPGKQVEVRTGLLGGPSNLIFNRFTGPGRIGIQRMYLHMPTEE